MQSNTCNTRFGLRFSGLVWGFKTLNPQPYLNHSASHSVTTRSAAAPQVQTSIGMRTMLRRKLNQLS
jgi:hypothetical protein